MYNIPSILDSLSYNSVICLAGATASGKSALSLELASKLNGVIINADSCQIYRDIPIITAQPSPIETETIPHLGYGFIDLYQEFSVANWGEMVAKQIKEVHNQNKIPILVGGTGFYFHALHQGLAQIPDTPPEVRNYVRNLSAQELYEQLNEKDKISAQKFLPTDTQRLARALEVIIGTNIPIHKWQENNQKFLPENSVIFHNYALMPPRDWLYERINRRFEIMLTAGAMEEAEYILSKGTAYIEAGKKIVGLSQILSYIMGEYSYEEMCDKGKQSSRNYAKRQMTWFRNKGSFSFI